MEQIINELHIGPILSSIVYSVIGIVIFILAYKIIDILTPYQIHKEISEDHNVALGVIIGSVVIAIGLIISAAIS